MSDETPETEYGFSYEYGIDVDITPDNPEPTWQRIRFAKVIAPTAAPKEIDGQTYDDKGADHPIKLGESWELQVEVQQQRLENGFYLPEIEALMAACAPDATGAKATRRFRWYDKPAQGAPNPNDAFEGRGTVTMTRADTSTAGLGGWQFTVKGQGPRKKILNPLIDATKPTISGITPTGKRVGGMVKIAGGGLTGATEVKFGAQKATEFQVTGDSILAVIPTGASGAVDVTVKTPKGTSAAVQYTVAG